MAGFESLRFMFAKEINEKVSEIIPVHIEEEDIESCPKFGLLLEDLCNYIGNGGVTKTLNKQLEQAEEKFTEEKCKYFQTYILYSTIDKILEEHEIQNLKGTPISKENELYSSLRSLLNIGEICKYLPSENDDKQKIRHLGLTKDFVLSHAHPVDAKGLKTKILPEVERRIHEKCKNVLLYHGQESSDKLVFAKISQLPSILANEKSALKEEQLQIYRDKKLINKQIEHYFESLIDAIELLKRMLELHQNDIEFKSALSHFYAAKCEALLLKARVLELQILCETYTTETVAALKIIREQLQQRETLIEQELEEKTNVLKAYESVGETFDALVKEYTKLTTDIENKKWTLKELKKSKECNISI